MTNSSNSRHDFARMSSAQRGHGQLAAAYGTPGGSKQRHPLESELIGPLARLATGWDERTGRSALSTGG